MKKLKNWDNQTWLSSKNYINQFNKFLNNRVRFNKNMKILVTGAFGYLGSSLVLYLLKSMKI